MVSASRYSLKLKLAALDATLVALLAAAAWQLHVESVRAHLRENRVVMDGVQQGESPMPFYYAAFDGKPLHPAEYDAIFKQNLFAKDRSPTVLVEQQPPPPRPVMPPLPVLRGILYIEAAVPTAIMSEKAEAPAREVRPGESIGEFKLLAVDRQEITFMWNGEPVRRRPDEMRDRDRRPLDFLPPKPPAPDSTDRTLTGKKGPGVPMGAGRRACYPGDSTPVGTIVDGFRKVEWETPWATGCAWEPADKR